jgi:outer membrane protein OmpA-like peptidoglycan-associated protein
VNHHSSGRGFSLPCIGLVLAVMGCATNRVSDLDRSGHVRRLVWPDSSHAYRPNGTFADPVMVRIVRSGMSADQVRSTLGSPHFNEGYDAREWDYLFHFRRAGGGVETCRFKVLFDSSKHSRQVQATYWNPVGCEASPSPLLPTRSVVADAVSSIPSGAESSIGAVHRIDLSADVLFAFDQSELQSVLPSGRSLLAKLIPELQRSDVRSVEVDGYADELGSPAYNQSLSERRASAVRDYLIANGVASDRVRAVGFGARDPIVECGDLPRAAMVRCLAPNRRVVLAVTLQLTR